jgi:cytoskeletal protein RodZ
MPAFGENLRREREMRGVSLEEIASATKISLRFLHAIEEEDFAKLPGGIFGRSFIRTYARYLGLDEERVMAEYQLAAQPKADVDLHRMTAGSPAQASTAARPSFVATLVAVVLLAGGYALFRYSRRATEIPVPPPPSQAVTPAPPAPPVEPPASPNLNPAITSENPTAAGATPVPVLGAAPETSPQPAAGGAVAPPPAQPATAAGTNTAPNAGLVLQVAATERAWVAVEADGKIVFQRPLDPNEVETVKARDSFDVTTGNAQAIILTLNGETLKPLGHHGEVKSVHITRADLKNPAP